MILSLCCIMMDNSQSVNFSDLPEKVQLLTLSFVPADDLITHCRLVSQYWKYLVDQQTLWSIKYERDYHALPASKILDQLDLKKIYFHGTFTLNLLRNWDAESEYLFNIY